MIVPESAELMSQLNYRAHNIMKNHLMYVQEVCILYVNRQDFFGIR